MTQNISSSSPLLHIICLLLLPPPLAVGSHSCMHNYPLNHPTSRKRKRKISMSRTCVKRKACGRVSQIFATKNQSHLCCNMVLFLRSDRETTDIFFIWQKSFPPPPFLGSPLPPKLKATCFPLPISPPPPCFLSFLPLLLSFTVRHSPVFEGKGGTIEVKIYTCCTFTLVKYMNSSLL